MQFPTFKYRNTILQIRTLLIKGFNYLSNDVLLDPTCHLNAEGGGIMDNAKSAYKVALL